MTEHVITMASMCALFAHIHAIEFRSIYYANDRMVEFHFSKNNGMYKAYSQLSVDDLWNIKDAYIRITKNAKKWLRLTDPKEE